MGEVIRGVFGNPSPGPEKQEEKEVVSEQPARSKKEQLIERIESGQASEYELLMVKLLMEAQRGNTSVENLVRSYVEVGQKMEQIDGCIRSLGNFVPSRDVLASSEQYWMSLSDEDLKAATLGSSEFQWRKDPSRYLALIREWSNRVKRAADNLK